MSLITMMLKGGLLVLLPLLVSFLLIMEMAQLVVAIATPLADLFPAGTFDKLLFHPIVMAIILLLATSFMIGLFMKSKTAVHLGKWFEEKSLDRLPIYPFVKRLIYGLLGAEEEGDFNPALLDTGGGQRVFCYIVEDHGDGDLTIIVPSAPSAFSGLVKIVPKSLVTPIESKLSNTSKVLSQLGIGACQLIKQKAPQTSTEVRSVE